MEFKGNPECNYSMDSNTGPSMGSKGFDIQSLNGGAEGVPPSPVIVCIAKLEQNYIEEFVQYHLALGFTRIYLFDNEDVPTYAELLKSYVESGHLYVTHLPRNDHCVLNDLGQYLYIPVQYLALHIFTERIMSDPQITHVAHIDIDEFIVLKKHENISEFIKEYIKDDCAGIGMNWRIFGSSFNTEPIDKPVTMRFTMCEEKGHQCIKTIFKKEEFVKFDTCHAIVTKTGKIKSTNGSLPEGPFNYNVDYSVIQLNHYKCKTLPEFRYIRTRQRADAVGETNEDVDANFKQYDINEIEELTARNKYMSIKGTKGTCR